MPCGRRRRQLLLAVLDYNTHDPHIGPFWTDACEPPKNVDFVLKPETSIKGDSWLPGELVPCPSPCWHNGPSLAPLTCVPVMTSPLLRAQEALRGLFRIDRALNAPCKPENNSGPC